MHRVRQYIEKKAGYKIINDESHLRLESKLHISKFYYAQQMFQRNYYTARFSFLIVRDFIKRFKDIDEMRGCLKYGLTIIGYGLYSELLTNEITEFLREIDKDTKLDHNLIDDIDELELIKYKNIDLQNILIVIPITSTGSTINKIIEKLNLLYKEKNIYDSVYTAIIVPDINIKNEPNDIEKKFGWESSDVNSKRITINGNMRFHLKYFIELESKWHNIESCPLCYPDLDKDGERRCENECCECNGESLEKCVLDEKILLATDKTSTKPQLILSYPFNFTEKIDKTITFLKNLNNDDIILKHCCRGDNHFEYYFIIEQIFAKRKEDIKADLVIKKTKFKDKKYIQNHERVIIIAPGHFTNAGFVNIVNNVLFHGAASVFHYDIENENFQNQSYLSHNLDAYDKVIFVDDTITTGETFFKLNKYIKNISKNKNNNKNNKNNNVFDLIITLLDRSDSFTYEEILSCLKGYENGVSKIQSFNKIPLPVLVKKNDKCPLCYERERYLELASASYLQQIKSHFYRQANKLNLETVKNIIIKKHDSQQAECSVEVKKTDNELFEEIKDPKRVDNIKLDYKKSRKEKTYKNRIIYTVKIINWFSKKENKRNFKSYNYYAWEYEVFGENNNDVKGVLSERTAIILKILTQPTFRCYKPIAERVFKWCINLLDIRMCGMRDFIKNENNTLKHSDLENTLKEQLKEKNEKEEKEGIEEKIKEEIKKRIDKNEILYNILKDVKFLIRRCAFMNSNYITSYRFLSIIKYVCNEKMFKILISNFKDKLNKLENDMELCIKYTPTIGNNNPPLKAKDIINDYINVLQAIENVSDFHVFYVAQIKELMIDNEMRSINLEKKLVALYNPQKDCDNVEFKKIARVIREESCLLFSIFWSKFKNKISHYCEKNEIKESLKEFRKIDVNDYNIINSFLGIYKTGYELVYDEHFITMLQLNSLFEYENGMGDYSLSDKTNLICQLILEIIEMGNGLKRENSGMFFIVKYQDNISKKMKGDYKRNCFLAFNEGECAVDVENYWDINSEDNYLMDFLTDYTNSSNVLPITIEYLRKNDKKWKGVYSDHIIEEGLHVFKNNDNIKNAFIIKLNESGMNAKSLGTIVFYTSENMCDVNINTIRYLLLSRIKLGEFITQHHKNNEFRDWYELNKKRKLSNLAKHGTDQLLKLLSYDDEKLTFAQIYKTQDQLQSIYNSDLLNKNKKNAFTDYFSYYYEKNITYEYFEKIFKMAIKMYGLKELEFGYDIDKKMNVDSNIQFTFPNKLLDVFLFELIINSKKNRWRFLNGQNVTATDSKKEFSKPYFELTCKQRKNVLVINTSNTSPKSTHDLAFLCKKDSNFKKSDILSGVHLIKEILYNSGYKLGKMKFREKTLNENVKLCMFTVSLILVEIKLYEKNSIS